MTPNYTTGERIRVGDRVIVGNSLEGVVVAVIDDDSYSKDFSKVEWGHYRTGVLVNTPEMGLVFYQKNKFIKEFKKID